MLIIFLSVVLTFSYVHFSFSNRFNLLKTARLKTTDFFLLNRYNTSTKPDIIKKIVVINIDEDTFTKLKEQWPLNRGFTAYFLEKMSKPESRPRIVGIGLVFTGKSDSNESDLWLASAFKKFGNAVLASYFNPDGELVLPEARLFNAAKAVGFINSPVDPDQVIRRNNPFIFLKNKYLSYSFVSQIFANLEGFDLQKSSYDVSAGALRLFSTAKKEMLIPADIETNSTKINYLAKAEDFKSVSLWEAMTSLVPPSVFKDKIILVGTNMEITKDVYLTPLGEMPSMYIHANFLMDMLLNRFLKEIPIRTTIILLFALVLTIAFIRTRLSIINSLALLLAILGASYYYTTKYIAKDTIIDFFGIALLTTLTFLIVSAAEYTYIILENVKLKKLAITDGLTGLYVYRYFEVKLAKEITIALQTKKELSLVIFDIDNFKKFNDNYGHEAGNEVLRNVSGVLRNRCRQTDTICRFGGEEFVSILGITDIERAGKYAEAIRKSIEVLVINWNGKPMKVTVSAGVSSLNILSKKTALDLVNSADKALYAAKNAGRNKTILANQIEQS
ncbi:MAG: diguanylate cyclase [Candidatus Omnitrophota bacterium]